MVAAVEWIFFLLSMHPQNPLQKEVMESRRLRQNGVLCGGCLFFAAGSIGMAGGIFDAQTVLSLSIATVAASAFNTLSFNEYKSSLPKSTFQVKVSLLEGAGNGLFSTVHKIPSGTFLFSYEGERLDEDEYFERYPNGQGRYVATIPAAPWSGNPTFIDGADPSKSGLARFMNSMPKADANVVWRKQRFGPQAGNMYFYASCNIEAGEELCFEYGEQYWGAVRDV
mmetsp:Transcript_909/g.1055  ORF Transcript_909/g.1055 Transcript_909/m.1055 type:complete len:225 (-) Transcript_909:141-815(-)